MSVKPVVNENFQYTDFRHEAEFFEGSFDKIIQDVFALKEKYKDCLDVEVRHVWYSYEDHDYEIEGMRLETDYERACRVSEEKRQLARWEKEQLHKEIQKQNEIARVAKKNKEREEQELEEYLRLKAKFEDK